MKIFIPLTSFLLINSSWAIKGEYADDRFALKSTCKLRFHTYDKGELVTGICSSSFLGNKTFITADHCHKHIGENLRMENVEPPTVECPGEKPYTINHSISQNEGGFTYHQDIALFKVAEDPQIDPLPLYTDRQSFNDILDKSKDCYLNGYGLDNDENYGNLKSTQITNFDNNILSFFGESTKNTYRARVNRGDKGDSGGPLWCLVEGKPYLFGVISSGINGINFSDIHKLEMGNDFIQFYTNQNSPSPELFKKVLNLDETCRSLANCLESISTMHELTTEVQKVFHVLAQQSGNFQVKIKNGDDLEIYEVDEVWKKMIEIWQDVDCYNNYVMKD